MKSAAPLIVALVAVFALLIFGVTSYMQAADISIGLHGWVALGLGTIASLALSGGLFWLTFHSARSGHDDTVGLEDRS